MGTGKWGLGMATFGAPEMGNWVWGPHTPWDLDGELGNGGMGMGAEDDPLDE